jgi:hypothetical protein
MPDVAPLYKVDHVFGDVCGVVADALNVLGNENQLECSEHDSGILHHVSEQLAEHLVAEAIHLVVAYENTASQLDIALDERVEAISHHAFRNFAHSGQIHVRLDLGMAKNAQGGLGDINGLIADSLQIAIDAADRENETKILSHGLLKGQQALDAIVDLDLHFVDGAFFLDHSFSEMFFGVEHGVNSLVDSPFRKAAHPQ